MGYSVTDDEADVVMASRGSLDTAESRASPDCWTSRFASAAPVRQLPPRRERPAALHFGTRDCARRQSGRDPASGVAGHRSRVPRGVESPDSDQGRREAARRGRRIRPTIFRRKSRRCSSRTTPRYKFDAADWAKRLRKLSAEFTKYPGALNSERRAWKRSGSSKTLVTTEGTRLEHGRLFARLMITARGKAADGMDLSTMESFEADDPSKLPKDAQILAAVEKAGKNLTSLLRAPPADPFVGPAILSGRAAGVFFHEIFGHRIEGHRQKDESEGPDLHQERRQAGAAGFSFGGLRSDARRFSGRRSQRLPIFTTTKA